VTDLVFKEIMPNARLLTLEVFGKQISFDLEAKDVEKFRKAYDEGAKNEREAKNAAAPLQLEEGQWYEDEEKELWQVKDKIEHTCQHPDGTKIDFQVIHYLAQNNKGLKRRFYSNGSCVEMKGANLVRKAPPVESEKRSRTFAETLREQAANFNSIEKRVARIKEMAAEAASNGLLKMEVDSYVLYDNMLQEELAKFGFFVYGEYHQNWHNPTPYLAKVWLDWSEKI